MVVHNNGSVKCVCSIRIYEEASGGDGIDPCRRVLDPNWLKRAIYRAICARAKERKKETDRLWS